MREGVAILSEAKPLPDAPVRGVARPAGWAYPPGVPLAVLTTACLVLLAAGAAAADREDNRRVLALYDSTEIGGHEPRSVDVHVRFERPLNWLGIVVDYHDVNRRPLPRASAYRGIIVWLRDDRMREPAGYFRWLRDALRSGTRLVVVGGLGAAGGWGGTSQADDAKAVLADLGLRHDPSISQTRNPFAIETRDDQPQHFGFETSLPAEGLVYDRLVPTGKSLSVWRTVRRKDVPKSEGVAVAVGPRGGFVLDTRYVLRVAQRPFYMASWDMNPFDFLEAALDCAPMLRPDVTTVCGARAAYSHIDGDGMANLTVDIPGRSQFAGQVILDHVLKRYAFPITVGPIAGRVDKEAKGTTGLVALGRALFALPNVQPGCHGYAHPLDWRKGTPGLRWNGYKFSPAFETTGAMHLLNRVLLHGKRRVEVYLWTGDCLPTEAAVAECDRMGVENLNGGDSRYDSTYRSVTNLSALARRVGSRLQVYASAQNENTYTGLWTRNFGGYASVIETFERSEQPRRLLPVNVYYHLFSGERMASLRAVQKVYTWSQGQPLCWIHAAEYVRSVRGFLRARCGRTADGGYWVRDYAPCNTVRLDRCGQVVDMARARGVLGFSFHAGSLYVSLAPGPEARFSLTREPPQRPCLWRSTCLLRDVTSGARTWSARARTYAAGSIELQGLPRSASCRVATAGSASVLTADARGRLNIPLARGTGEWVEVRVAH